MNSQTWENSNEASQQLRNGEWTWLIHSSRDVQESRAQWAANFWPQTHRIGVDRADVRVSHRFQVKTASRATSNIAWTALDDWLKLEIKPDDSVLLDMCLLGFDAILYLLPALLQLNLRRLGCLYVAPTEYAFPQDPSADLLLQAIEQPKAYVASLSHDKDSAKSRHVVFLGFDHARAWKFIDARGWKLSDVHVALGDPAFVENGVEQARKAANPWLPQFEAVRADQVHRVKADEPLQAMRLCQKMFEQSDWLDIVPIGPKPMALGILWFYFTLKEPERARVRLLFDFPSQQSPRSLGIGKVYVYDCTGLMIPKENDD
jgi:hypothetical protein